MPTYLFRCRLGHQKEIFAEFGKAPRLRCWCLSKMDKVICHPPVRFVGLGFSKSWGQRDIENTYDRPNPSEDVEDQMQWEEHKEKQDAYRKANERYDNVVPRLTSWWKKLFS